MHYYVLCHVKVLKKNLRFLLVAHVERLQFAPRDLHHRVTQGFDPRVARPAPREDLGGTNRKHGIFDGKIANQDRANQSKIDGTFVIGHFSIHS